MLDPATFIGAPINFQDICKVYPATVREVVTVLNFPIYQKILTMTEEELQYEYKKEGDEKTPTPLEFILICSYQNENFEKIAKLAFEFFTHESIRFDYENKKITGFISSKTIGEENYFDFQNAIRATLGLPKPKPPEPIDPTEDPRVAEIKRRARERDRIKAKQKNKNGLSLTTCLTAICCMGIGITPLNIGELSYASIGQIMDMMQEKEKYDIDIRSLLAGADSKKIQPKYWIRNNDKE